MVAGTDLPPTPPRVKPPSHAGAAAANGLPRRGTHTQGRARETNPHSSPTAAAAVAARPASRAAPRRVRHPSGRAQPPPL